jgi:hypothetical protein
VGYGSGRAYLCGVAVRQRQCLKGGSGASGAQEPARSRSRICVAACIDLCCCSFCVAAASFRSRTTAGPLGTSEDLVNGY